MYFAERRFILLQVLLQQVCERLRLRGTQVDALKILDGDRIRPALVTNRSEEQEKVPQVHPHLHAVGVIVSIIRRVGEVHARWNRLGWTHSYSIYEEGAGLLRSPGTFLDPAAIAAAIADCI